MRLTRGLLAPLLLLACTACVPSNLAFRADKRVSITSPEDNAKVSLPVTIRWTIRDFDVVEPGSAVRKDSGYFAVFVDRAPMPPGEDLAWLARKDDACLAEKGCPDAKSLASKDVYITTDTELVLAELDEELGGGPERHKATIVLIDGSGNRLGESAFHVDFEVHRGAES